jgi:hypothetical protein
VIFIKGSSVLFSIGLAIFHELQPQLLLCDNLVEIMKVVDSAPNTLVDSVKFMKVVD